MTPSPVDFAQLRAAAPGSLECFELALVGREPLRIIQVHRHLPGRRLACRARWGNEQLLVKLFFRHRDYRRERAGLELLHDRGVPSPRIRWHYHAGDAWLLATEWLPEAHALDSGLCRPHSAADARAVFALLGTLHRAGLIQEDAHLDNFLLSGARAYAIDGAGIRRAAGSGDTTANLALLLAQFPPGSDHQVLSLAAAYGPLPAPRRLARARDRARRRRLRAYRRKCLRNCSEFTVERSWRRFTARRRDRRDRNFLELLADPGPAVAGAQRLKDGNTATVVRCGTPASDLVVKRYNVKNWRHALSRAPRRSRAWISWQNANLLAHIGVSTPRALGLREGRWGPFRRVTYLITEASDGVPLHDWLRAHTPNEVPAWLDRALLQTLASLARSGISHGDLKATNFLVEERLERLLLIDLDAMRLHRSGSRHRRALQRDLRRFLANWDAGLQQHFARLLAPLAAGHRIAKEL